jgi:hypothetical protein
MSSVTRVAIDETAARRRHNDNIDQARVLFATEGRDGECRVRRHASVKDG